jgi:hypothetical protein
MESRPPGTTTLYPGAVTTKYGTYLVTHSTAHHPPTETFIDRGIILPDCLKIGCHVTFELVKLISCRDVDASGGAAENARA